MKKTPMRSLQAFQTPVITPKPKAPPPPHSIIEQTKVVLTQSVLYRTKGGADKLVRPGHKTIPQGSVGTVTAVTEEGKFQVEFRSPVAGILSVSAPEITAWEKL